MLLIKSILKRVGIVDQSWRWGAKGRSCNRNVLLLSAHFPFLIKNAFFMP